MANLLSWVQSFFYGGYSDDRFLGIKNSFQSAKAIEIRKKPGSITLAKLVEKQSGSVVTDLINAFVTIRSSGDVIAFGSSGNIYRNATGSGTWVLVYTDTHGTILNAYEYNDYLYWATTSYLARIQITNIDASWTGDVNETYKTFANGNANCHPMIEKFNNLYVGDGKALAELDSVGVWTATKIPIFSDEEIVALKFVSGSMRIYSRKTTKIDDGQLYFWNGISTTYNENVAITGTYIHAVATNGNQDFVIAGRKPVIMICSGLQKIIAKAIPGLTDSNECFIAPNAIVPTASGCLFGVCKSGTNSLYRGIWSYDALSKDYPLSLNFEYPTSQAGETDLVGAVHTANNQIYMGWKSGANYGIDAVNQTKYAAQGELVSRVFDGNLGYQPKNALFLQLAFAPLNAGEKIEIYLRANLDSAWGTAVLTLDYNNTADRNITFAKLTKPGFIKEATHLESKIVLYCGTSNATSPEVFDLSIAYEPVKSVI